MAAIYATLFWCALQVTLFLTLAAPIYLLVRRRSPHAATFAAASSLAAVILLSALAASPWPRWSLAMVKGERVALANGGSTITDVGGDQAKASATSAGAALGADETTNPASPLAALWEAVQFAATPTTSAMTAGAPADEPGSRWTVFVVALFLAGMAISGVHLVAGLVAVRRLIAGSRPLEERRRYTAELASLRQRLNIDRPVSLHESSEIATPATVGWRRPAILLPTAWRTWSDVERRSVLAHELAHIAQHDFAAWLVARGAIVVHFYHPLVRWFASRLQLDQELAADAAAVRLIGDRQQYLHALANLALATPMHRIAGPARTFIPGRSLLVRRVEMLRTNASIRPTTQPTSTLRWAVAPLLAALAVIAAGLRSPAPPAVRAAEPETAIAEKPQVSPDSGYDFSYVPDDFVFLFAFRPSEIATSPHLNSLAELLNETIRPQFKAESLSQITSLLPLLKRDSQGAIVPGTGSEYTIFRSTSAVDFQPLIEADYGPTKTEDVAGKQVITWGKSKVQGTIEFYSPNDRTLVSTPRPGLLRLIEDPAAGAAPPAAGLWLAEATGPVFGVVNFPALKQIAGMGLGGPPIQMIQPVVDLADYAMISVEDGDSLSLKARFACRNPQDAAIVEQTLQAALVIVKNIVTSQRAALSPPIADPKSAVQSEMITLLDLAEQVLATAELETAESVVNLTASVQDPAKSLEQVLVPQLRGARQAAKRAQTQNNLKNLALAALTYESNMKTFPPAIVYGRSAFPNLNSSGDKSAHVPRSWRVELLPLLGQEELYKQYRLDQPWDSEANLKVLRQMPVVYRSPFDATTSTNNASYFAVVGPGTVFDGEEGTPLTEIRDGTSNTLLWVEAKRDIPWTKPEDIAYAPGEAVPAFGGWKEKGRFTAALCDGSIREFVDVAEPELKQLIEKADGADLALKQLIDKADSAAGLNRGSTGEGVLSPAPPLDE